MVILGNDAQLAARPATPVQLAHACLAAGFHAAVPASWGDELVAGATLAALASRGARPAIHCACPHVARRVLAVGSELAPHLVSLVAPPVAAARYLRLHATGELRLTYVGRCPAAADDSIDARLTPEELFAQFADHGVDLVAQPEVFESVIPPDRRRHLSLPGGLPSSDILWARTRCVVATITSGEFASELADLVLAASDTLIDLAPGVGCACSGVLRGSDSGDARAAVTAIEPPRSPHAIVEETSALRLDLTLPVIARRATDIVAETGDPPARDEQRVLAGPAEALGDAPPPPPVTPSRRPRLTPPGMVSIPAPLAGQAAVPNLPPRRRSPTGTPRIFPGPLPVSSDSEGRMLPRAYVARRRSPRSGIPVVSDVGNETGTIGSIPDAAVPARPMEPASEPQRALGSASRSVQPSDIHGSRAPRTSLPRHAPAPADEAAARAPRESERPLVPSVEPATSRPMTAVPAPEVHAQPTPDIAIEASLIPAPVATPALPAATDVRQPTAAGLRTPRIASRASVASGVSLLRRHVGLVVGCVLAGTALLLGVAIGYSVGRRGTGTPQSGAETDRSSDSSGAAAVTRLPSVQESVSSGGIAPSPKTTRRAPVRVLARSAGGARPRASAISPTPFVGRSPTAAAPATNAPALPPAAVQANATPAVTLPDTAGARARRDSLSAVEALAAERESIRREIGQRRARVDSIERARLRLDSIQRANQADNRPPVPER